MPISRTEVEAILAKLAAEQRESLDWKNSIVDLMRLLKLDSSLDARKQLAQELGYTGALDGSATMNVWLQKEVRLHQQFVDAPLQADHRRDLTLERRA
jgi:hypothetical protein